MKIDKEGIINYFLQQLKEVEELERNGLAGSIQTWNRKRYLKRTIEKLQYDLDHKPQLFKNK